MGKEQPTASSPEQPAAGIGITGISLDFDRRSLSLTTADRHLATIRLAPEGLIFEAAVPPSHEVSPATIRSSESQSGVEAMTADPGVSDSEKVRASVFQGKLKSKPIPGRPDARGKPTAWARFAAHDADQEGAHLYSATFHRHTANLALSMDKDAQLTVQGFPHEQNDPDSRRLDTLSVINVLDYPGKPEDR
jgi:hypothetical protein